jgi:hypothetical protein
MAGSIGPVVSKHVFLSERWESPPGKARHVNPMTTTIAVGVVLLLASIATPGAVATTEPSQEATGACDFIIVSPFYPFVTINWNCPPIPGGNDGF